MKHNSIIICVIVSFLLENSESFVSSRSMIAGNRTISECINGERLNNSAEYMTTAEFVRKHGYKAEEHFVITKDKYILTMHRIPGAEGAPPVFLQHGILMSSYDWVVTGKDKGLAFILADQGYDVWMGNARGNTYSRCHLNYTTANYSFWNFSWHEMGIYDLPAEIGYVAKVTKQNITYIGYSMGTTMFYVMASEDPETAAKVKAMFSLGSVTYLYNGESPLRYITRFTRFMQYYAKIMGTYEFLSQGPLLRKAMHYLCLFELQKKLCVRSVFALIGLNSPQFNYAILPQVSTHTPAGTSLKVVIHYFQQNQFDGFRKFDYGEKNNLMIYNSTTPPSYNLSNVRVPIGIFWSDNDYFAHPTDVKKFADQLPNIILSHKVADPNWSHIDYLYGIDAVDLVFPTLLSAMKLYT